MRNVCVVMRKKTKNEGRKNIRINDRKQKTSKERKLVREENVQ